jgi:acyl-CoA thioester hydrolase
MSAIYEREFRVRYDECDAYGHVNHANYLRYMQETAFDASANVGYDFAAYERMNRHWLVRETEISFLRPLHYGDTLIVKTWVADCRRVRSRRIYELRLANSGDPIASASTDWVFLNTADLRPATIPPQMARAFIPEGQATAHIKRDAFPEPPALPPGVFHSRRRVNWRDIDGAHHANNTVYPTYLEDCAVELAWREGWPMERMIRTGFGIVARNFRIEYKHPALMDDELEIATWVSDVKKATAVRHYTVRRVADQMLLARARALWVWVDLKTGRPMRIPLDFLADLSANITQQYA